MIPGQKKYARDTENYNIKPNGKARLWAEIVEAAQMVIDRGGGNIRFVTEDRVSRHLKEDDDGEEEL